MNRDGRKLPIFCGKPNTPRTCDHAEGPGAEACGNPAVLHIGWRLKSGASMQVGFACETHRDVVEHYEPFQYHELGPACGMPGALWDYGSNRCLYPKGLPVLEETRRAGSLVPA